MHRKSISQSGLTAGLIISVCAFLHVISPSNADGEYSTLGSSDGGDYQNNQAGTSTPILISPGASSTSPQLQQEYGHPSQQLLPTFPSYGAPVYTPFLEPLYRPYPYSPNLPPPTPPYGFGPPGWGFNHGWNNNPGWSVPIQQLPPPNFFSGWGWPRPGPFRR